MPTYDFICLDCRQRFEIFMTYREYGLKPVACSHCGGANVRRRVSRVRVLKSDAQRLEALGDPSMLDGIDDDPVALGRMMRKMGSELGEDLPPEFGDVVARLEAGQSPEEIEKAVPDLADSFGGSDLGGLDVGP